MLLRIGRLVLRFLLSCPPSANDPATRATTFVAVLGFALVGPLGCSHRDPDIVPVRGKVLLDGKPLALKDVSFAPVAGAAGRGGFARTQPDGSFELRTVVPGAIRMYRGATPGNYIVIVTEPNFAMDLLPAQSAPKGSEIPVPAVYQDPAKTPLRAEVGHDAQDFLFELSSKAK